MGTLKSQSPHPQIQKSATEVMEQARSPSICGAATIAFLSTLPSAYNIVIPQVPPAKGLCSLFAKQDNSPDLVCGTLFSQKKHFIFVKTRLSFKEVCSPRFSFCSALIVVVREVAVAGTVKWNFSPRVSLPTRAKLSSRKRRRSRQHTCVA